MMHNKTNYIHKLAVDEDIKQYIGQDIVDHDIGNNKFMTQSHLDLPIQN